MDKKELEVLLAKQAEAHKKETEALLAAQATMMEAMFKRLQAPGENQTATAATAALSTEDLKMQNIHDKLAEFHYDQETSTFDVWYDRFETVFTKDADGFSDAKKIEMLIRRLEGSVFDRIRKQFSPKKLEEVTFEEVIYALKKTFGTHVTTFTSRYNYIRMGQEACQDLMEFWEQINHAGDRIAYAEMKVDQLKALVFASGLKDKEFQKKVIAKLQKDETTVHGDLKNEIETYQKTKLNERVVNSVDGAAGFGIQRDRGPPSQGNRNRSASRPRAATPNRFAPRQEDRSDNKKDGCPCCGGPHNRSDCSWAPKNPECYNCGRKGHIARACRQPKKENGGRNSRSFQRPEKPYRSNTVHVAAAPMVQAVNYEARRRFIEVDINGKPRLLQEDGGSDVTIVSERF